MALEGARAAAFLKPGGVLMVNTQRISPMPVITGATQYPEDPLAGLTGCKVEAVDALALAVEAGNQKALNLVLLGMLSRHLSFTEEDWKRAIAECVPRKTLEVNLRAFEAGRACIDSSRKNRG